MKKYNVKVNGKLYEVEVERQEGNQVDITNVTPLVTPSTPAKTIDKSVSNTEETGTPIECGATGKIWKVVATEGSTVMKGDTVIILESMKMEIPVVSPVDGIVTKILVAEGSDVESGQKVAMVKPK